MLFRSLATSAWFNFQVDMMRCVWTILPAACLWGASFPLALAAAANSSEDSGRLVGSVYAANTVGAIFGATGFSVVFVPLMGSQDSQRLLMLLAAVAALIILMPAKRWIAVALTVVISVFAIRGVTKVPWLAMAYGRRMLTVSGTGRPLYEGEGMNSSIVVSQLDGGQIYFHVSGKTALVQQGFGHYVQMGGASVILLETDGQSAKK